MIGKVMLFLALVCCATAAIDNCKQGGEYCLNHWDCCSNTCLSYLYKCSRIQKPQAAGRPVQSSPAVFAPAAIPTIRPDTASLESLLQIVFRPLEIVPASGRELNLVELRLGEENLVEYETTTTLNPTTEGPPPCKEIGSKCYTNDECCSSRCHGFLHQCVT